MMTGLLTALHPSFDALSAHADQTDLGVARTRVGRHVARCAACREVISDIRELGNEARRTMLPAMPSGLWSRIEAAASANAPAVAIGASSAPAKASMHEHHPAGRRMVRGIAAAAIAAGLVAALAWPRSKGLEAAGTSRFTFTPSRPVPGGRLRVRYDAPAWLKDASALVLVGRFAQPAGRNVRPFGARVTRELADSLGMLTRAPDGAFVGTVALPADFLAVSLSVLDPVHDDADADGPSPWIVIGGAPTGAPSLAALLSAHEVGYREYYGDSTLRPRQAVDAADSLKRYFPLHPAGWAFSRTYGVSRGRFDLLRFFETAERKYTSMFDALSAQPKLDAERLHDMVVFAQRIDEPSEALRWATRLVDEHPEDSRTLFDLAGALHALELQSVPADSIRHALPALDRAYRSGPVPNMGFADAQRLGVGYGDSATAALWQSRAEANGATGNIWMMAVGKHASRDSATWEVRLRAESGCALPRGQYPLAESAAVWRSRCELYRGVAYGYLSRVTLEAGRYREALAEADSAIVSMRRGNFCSPSRGYHSHALAALALGDTMSATRDFISASAGYPPSNDPMRDTARVHLGPRFDEVAVRAGADSARRAATVCEERKRRRRQAYLDRIRAGR